MTHDAPNDLEIRRAQKGDRTGLESVLLKTSPYILALCRTWCRPPLEADDIAQESLLRVAKQLSSYRGESAFFSWVYTVTYRTFLDQARKEKRRNTIVHMEPLNSETSDHVTTNSDFEDTAETISQALSCLDSVHHDVLLAIDVQGLSYESAAQALQIPVGTVRSRLARARLSLRKILQENGTFPPSDAVSPHEEQS